ncbi:MAG: class II fructose-bisphosphate aldolase [Clostridia bacterium]|nr:class II fructose-bisphosphate aldolase [Clostridia bacterium]
MPYCSMGETLKYVRDSQAAIAACNVHNLEFTQATVRAAEEMRAPIILMLSEPTLKYAEFEQITRICLWEAEHASVPVAIALDHGKDDTIIKRCIKAGLSIMYDGSELPLQENISRTNLYLQLTKAAGLSLEGEVGALGSEFMGEEDLKQVYTNVEQAIKFAQECEIDALAISIGNMHGLYKRPPVFDIERLQAIALSVHCPIVLHGGSNVPDEQIVLARNNGAKKCNFGTDLRYAFFSTLAKEIETDTTQYKPFGILGAARNAVTEIVKEKIRVCGSDGIV